MEPKVFKNGITVKQLKDILNAIPETFKDGEPCEVWIETGKGTTSPVMEVWPLNKRGDCQDVELISYAYKN